MSPLLFYFFAALTVIFGAAVVANRNPVASALSLVVSFVGMAALLVGLEAYFIAIIEVLVYAGAVMVLFLFIIMLLDLRAEERRKFNFGALAAGGAVALAFIAQLWMVLQRFERGHAAFPPLNHARPDDVHAVGTALFTTHNLPLQVVGVLLLVATIGVIVLSKRELK